MEKTLTATEDRKVGAFTFTTERSDCGDDFLRCSTSLGYSMKSSVSDGYAMLTTALRALRYALTELGAAPENGPAPCALVFTDSQFRQIKDALINSCDHGRRAFTRPRRKNPDPDKMRVMFSGIAMRVVGDTDDLTAMACTAVEDRQPKGRAGDPSICPNCFHAFTDPSRT